jgi:hypothetical protein
VNKSRLSSSSGFGVGLGGSKAQFPGLQVLLSEGSVSADGLHLGGDNVGAVLLALSSESNRLGSLGGSGELLSVLSLGNLGLGLSGVNNEVGLVELKSLSIDVDALAALVGTTVIYGNTDAAGLLGVDTSSLGK